MQPAILIPAYEPDQPLVTLVKKIRGLRPDQTIIVINDGSSKDKQPIFDALKQYDVDLLAHPINLGKGQALKTGFMYYLNHYAHKMPGLVTADADGQHHPKDILKIVDQLAAAPNVLFLGSRKRKTSVPFRSRFGNTLTRYVFQLFSRVKIYDTQTGLRGIPNHLLFEMLKVSTSGYDFELEMLLQAAEEEIAIKEVPIKTIYIDRNISSHFNPISDSMKIYFVFARFSAISLLTAVLDYLLFIGLYYVSGRIVSSAIIARLVSGALNFRLNQRLTFRKQADTTKAILKYASLAICLALASSLLTIGFKNIGINVYTGKIISECILFIVSFSIQKLFIFNLKHER